MVKVSTLKYLLRRGGGIGRRRGLKILWGKSPCGFESRPRHLFHKPLVFYIFLFILGFIAGEMLSALLPMVLPRSGALDVITYKVSVGLENIRLDLLFLVLGFTIKFKISLLGIITSLIFVVIGRML